MDLSLLMKKNFRDFAENMSDIGYAHDEIVNIRQLIWEEEATLNLRIKFEELGIEFNNKRSNRELLQQMNELDLRLMQVREYIRAKDNRGVGYFHEDTKYENGLTSELLKSFEDAIDLSLLNDRESNHVMSMSNKDIEQAHNKIVNLRQLVWLQADKELRMQLTMDGIELSSENNRPEGYFKKLDELDLKLMEIRSLNRSKQKIDKITSQNEEIAEQNSQIAKLEEQVKALEEKNNVRNE